MISYRSFKRLLGETSLERKCRFLFGGGLLVLIAVSFYFYASLNRALIEDADRNRARNLIPGLVVESHFKAYQARKETEEAQNISEMVRDLKPDDLSDVSWNLITGLDGPHRPILPKSHDIYGEIKAGEPNYEWRDKEKNDYHYYEALYAKKSCINCHDYHAGQNLKEGDLMGAMHVMFTMDKTKKALALNNAILIATAIATSFLAMLAAYAIVRYVIVKPVLHLKDVSDGISRGTLDLRADIRTGDEFEELSHAFNRMLRHLVTIQEELRGVNSDLDGKIDQLAQVNLNLYETNKLKDNFLATMSHELRTPLNSILGFSEVLYNAKNLDDKQKRYVNNIQQSGKELTTLINDVLDLAKIESGKMQIQAVEFSINDLVARQADAISSLAEKKNIELNIIPSTHCDMVKQDPGKIQQILNNLLSNAVKFTPEGGRVKVEITLIDDKFFQILVEDTGIGIPLDDQETIFDKFRQGKSSPGMQDTMTREFGGTGLGLSIVKELTKLLEGEIFLESEFGKGSRFFVQLPITLKVEEFSQPLSSSSLESMVVADVRHANQDTHTQVDEFLNPIRVIDITNHQDNTENSTTSTVDENEQTIRAYSWPDNDSSDKQN